MNFGDIMEPGYIYAVENLINHKKYIGQTRQKYPNTRWSYHKNEARKGVKKHPLYEDMAKYGIDNFKFKIILKNLPLDKLDFYEILWIEKLNTRCPNGYNISKGGHILIGVDNPMYGKPSKFRGNKRDKTFCDKVRESWTDEKRKKYSEMFKGENNPMYGKRQSEDAKMKRVKCGDKNPFYGKHLYGAENPFYGKHHTDDVKEKLSQLKSKQKKPVAMLDINTEDIIEVFQSLSDAKKIFDK